jgi:hypothetical protein
MSGFQSKTYEYSGETNEWDDILIKKGIKHPDSHLIEKGLNPDDFRKVKEEEEPELTYDPMEDATVEQLDVLEDDFDDERALLSYREARIAELKEKRLRDRYGEVINISKKDWLVEVNEASKVCSVVVHLFQDGLVECQLMDECLIALAAKFKYIKFVRIKSTSAIENWPDKNCPTLFIYEEGEAKDQIMTLKQLGGLSMKASDLEWALVGKDVITDSEMVGDPRESDQIAEESAAIGAVRMAFVKQSREYDLDDAEDDYDLDGL